MNVEERAVQEDAARESGTWRGSSVMIRAGLRCDATAAADASAYAYASAYATAAEDANASAYANIYSDANAHAYANANVYANADAYADANGDANGDAQNFISAFSGGEHVKNGFYVWAQPSGGVVVLRIGYIRHVAGDEYEALHMVTPKRKGDYETMLADLAIDGPPKNWEFTRPIPGACPLNRFHILGPVPLNPDQWQKVCPRPADWVDQVETA